MPQTSNSFLKTFFMIHATLFAWGVVHGINPIGSLSPPPAVKGPFQCPRLTSSWFLVRDSITLSPDPRTLNAKLLRPKPLDPKPCGLALVILTRMLSSLQLWHYHRPEATPRKDPKKWTPHYYIGETRGFLEAPFCWIL